MFSDTNPPPAWTFSWFRNSINANLNVFVFFILDQMKISYCILPCNLSHDFSDTQHSRVHIVGCIGFYYSRR